MPKYQIMFCSTPIPKGTSSRSIRLDLAGWLGAEFQPVRLGGVYTQLGHAVDAHTQDQEERQALRRYFAKRYENERHSPVAAAQNAAFEKVKGLMASADLFDLAKFSEKDRDRYGPGS